MNFKRICAIAFSGILFAGGGMVIHANSSSDEISVSQYEQFDRGNGITVIYNHTSDKISGFLTTDELEEGLNDDEINKLLLEEAKDVILENTDEFHRIKSILDGTYEDTEFSNLELSTLEEIEKIECANDVIISYDPVLGKIIGFTYPNELEEGLNDDEINKLLLEEAKNVILENTDEFHRIKSILDGTYEDIENQNKQERIQYDFPIDSTINPFGSRNLFTRSISVGEKTTWFLRASGLTKDLEKAASVTVKAFDANRNATVFTISVGSTDSNNYKETEAYRILDFSATNNTSATHKLTGSFTFGK